MPILAKSYRVIAMDSMGYGMSDAPPTAFKISDYARTVRDFLLALDIKKTSLVGHHTGSTIAVEVAAAYPEAVDKLILSSCPYYTPEDRQARLSGPKARPLELTEDGSFLMEIWNRTKAEGPLAGIDMWRNAVVGALTAGTEETERRQAAYRAVFQYDEQARLPLIKSPTLLISGTEDLFHQRLEATRKLVPGCSTKVIEGGDGLITRTKPDEFAQAILDFLKSPGG